MTRTIPLAAALAALILAACAAPMTAAEAQGEDVCALPAAEILLEDGDPHAAGGTLLQRWEVPDAPVLWSATPPAEGGWPRFRQALEAQGGETDPVALLEAGLAANAAGAANPAIAHNNRIAMDNAGAWIRPAGCLEMLLAGLQHDRMDTFAAPTEFMAFVLRSPDGERLRIYSYTINQDGIGGTGAIAEPVARDHARGWRVLVGLHSHVFHPGNPALNGVLAPSAPDAGFHLGFHGRTGMGEAWITNGLHTIRMPAASFEDFAR